MDHTIHTITEWLKKQVESANMNGLVVGISGGLDSAVVANLIKRTFPNNSLGVLMPLKSNPIDIEHAKKVVHACQIKSVTIDLTETHQMMLQSIKSPVMKQAAWNEEKERLADANLRARLRMSTLYTIATNYNYLVVGTDNASEWYTGYFTKYGDGGVDLQPIVDLTKAEVGQLAEKLNVPEEIINKKPSADLWDGQTDENEMGTTYDMIDAYIAGGTVPDRDRAIIDQMYRRSEHKRRMAPQLRLKPMDYWRK